VCSRLLSVRCSIWRNSRPGYWANLSVVSALDVGFILFVVAPCHVSLAGGLPGPALWIAGAVLTTIGRVRAGRPVAVV
jgi:hypothetical protein